MLCIISNISFDPVYYTTQQAYRGYDNDNDDDRYHTAAQRQEFYFLSYDEKTKFIFSISSIRRAMFFLLHRHECKSPQKQQLRAGD